MKMTETQFNLIKAQLKKLTSQPCFYQRKLEGIDIDQIQSQEDFEALPFTWKGDLREAYPLGLQAVPDEEIVRIHSSSGTTGTPVIIPYTRQDVEDWTEMFKRCYETAGITNLDRFCHFHSGNSFLAVAYIFRHHQSGSDPDHTGLWSVDGRNRLPERCGTAGGNGDPHGSRQYG